MPKKPKVYRCTAAGDGWRCSEKFHAGAGGTIGDEPRCPGHYQQARRNPGGELQPLVDRSEPRELIKVYVTKQGREQLQARARKAGISVSALCASILTT